MIAVLVNTPAQPHSWYDGECCHADHCRPVARDELEELPDGCWRYRGNDTVYCDGQIKRSKDAGWHVCFTSPASYLHLPPKPLCVYVPSCC